MEYSTEEITFLLAGLDQLVERDTTWEDRSYQAARDRLTDLGLIITGGRPNAQGLVERIPLSLSRAGFNEARRLR